MKVPFQASLLERKSVGDFCVMKEWYRLLMVIFKQTRFLRSQSLTSLCQEDQRHVFFSYIRFVPAPLSHWNFNTNEKST